MIDLTRLLGVAGGLALIYTAFAVGISGGTEWLATAMRWRSKNLYEGIRSMLLEAKDADGNPVVDKLFNHPVIQGISKDPNILKFLSPRLPSYIPSDLFAKVLPQLLMSADRDRSAALTVDDLRSLVDDIGNPELKEALQTVLSGHFDSIDDAMKAIEGWYNMTMERVSGWYARRMWSVTFTVGLVTAVLLGVDTIAIAERLWNDPEYRQRMNQVAASELGALKKTIEASPDPAVSSAAVRLFPSSAGTSSPDAAQPPTAGADAPKEVDASKKDDPAKETPAPKKDDTSKKDDPTKDAKGAGPPKKDEAKKDNSGKKDDPTKKDGDAKKDNTKKDDAKTDDNAKKDDTNKKDDVKAKLDALRARLGPLLPEGMKDLNVPVDQAIARRIDEIAQAARKADLPIGHDIEGLHSNDVTRLIIPFLPYLKPLFGYLLTALAVSMGAKFWFDLLSNLVNVRIAGKLPARDAVSDSA
jgi:hypothetical protein